MTDDKGILRPRAYARLLTMIGDQLIKNEKVALIELIKNSYDADANWVQIRLQNFMIDGDENTLIKSKDSCIEIEDDGIGMSFETIQTVWLNPATPNKFVQKLGGNNLTKKGRIIQGEKGIGRFAVYKLGSTIELTTKSIDEDEKEILLINDLSLFGEELIHDGTEQATPKYLDQIEYLYEKREKPLDIVPKSILVRGRKLQRASSGTIIRITNLRGEWSFEKIRAILSDISKLSNSREEKNANAFICDILVNEQSQFKNENDDDKDQLEIRRDKAPIRVTEGK